MLAHIRVNVFKIIDCIPYGLRWNLSSLSKESIWDELRFALIITGNVELLSRNSYLKEEERGFNSTSGAYFSSKEGLSSLTCSSTLERVGGTCDEASKN